MTPSLLVETRQTRSGHLIGVLTLNSEATLNALSLEMVQAMLEQLTRWRDDPQLVAVWLQGAGEKAFCAGGDIVDMYHTMRAHPGTLQPAVETFFTHEYRLDHLIHVYPKPILVWGDGIVMGGGIGVLAGASHRLVTERSRLAMPEINIGLYPDVGGTYFLNRMPDRAGLFLGLTGAQFNGSDALLLGMADHLVDSTCFEEIWAALLELDWCASQQDHQQLTACLQQHALANPPQGWWQPHRQWIQQCCTADTLSSVVQRILAYQGDDSWLIKARDNLAKGSPITAHIVWQQLQRGALTLAECFRLELVLSCRLGQSGEFSEGVRALLIDRDRQPKWRYPDVESVPDAQLSLLFESPWTAEQHPLRDL